MRTNSTLHPFVFLLPVLTAVCIAAGNPSPARAECDSCGACQGCVLSVDSLMNMSYCELESLYRSLSAAEMPGGYYRGTLIVRKGTKPVAAGARLVWQGKWICPEQGRMINSVFGKPGVPAAMYMGESWIDGEPSLIFDYACSPAKFARPGRDEVRQICTGLYLGALHVREKNGCIRLANFFVVEAACR